MTPSLFSRHQRSIIKQAQNADLIVMGNQGADLDSIASALVLAWHLSLKQPEKNIAALIAIPRNELRLRPEAAFVFAEAKINSDNLLFLDDIDLETLLAKGSELILVDHNHLPVNLSQWEHRVTAVIDHHHDRRDFMHAAPRLIAKVGSTATLVGELVLQVGGVIDASSARLLLSAILLDTVNLNVESGRCTDRDQEVASQLLAICGEDQDSYYQRLNFAQHDLSALTSQELLGRDFKEWDFPAGKYGMSTVLRSLTDWQHLEADLVDTVAKFALKKELTFLIVMLASQSPDFQREIIIFCQEIGLHEKLTAYLDTQQLDLSCISGPEKVVGERGYVSFYSQGNVSISRKKLQPLVHSYLASALLYP